MAVAQELEVVVAVVVAVIEVVEVVAAIEMADQILIEVHVIASYE